MSGEDPMNLALRFDERIGEKLRFAAFEGRWRLKKRIYGPFWGNGRPFGGFQPWMLSEICRGESRAWGGERAWDRQMRKMAGNVSLHFRRFLNVKPLSTSKPCFSFHIVFKRIF